MTRVVISGLVAIHLAASVWHGSAHTQLAITLTPEKNLFVYVVILMAPLAAAGLVWTRYSSIGVWVFFLSMLGALIFGVYHHYVVVSPDNIGHLPAGSQASHSRFIASAAVIALLELASALYAACCLGWQRAGARGASTTAS
jgi:hypothetical protein